MFQIEKVLPRVAWESVTVKESNEELVELVESDRLFLGLISKPDPISFCVRKTIAEKLQRVAEGLSSGLCLAIIEGYRSMENQQKSWDRSFQALRDEHPAWSDEEIENQVRLVVARPHPLANHHCGGAVDLTLAYADRTLLDMGSPYPSTGYGMEIRQRFPMFSEYITEQQKENRKILRDVMVVEGFVWYPGEWWHYCYGDRMWAVYTGKHECMYGPIELTPVR